MDEGEYGTEGAFDTLKNVAKAVGHGMNKISTVGLHHPPPEPNLRQLERPGRFIFRRGDLETSFSRHYDLAKDAVKKNGGKLSDHLPDPHQFAAHLHDDEGLMFYTGHGGDAHHVGIIGADGKVRYDYAKKAGQPGTARVLTDEARPFALRNKPVQKDITARSNRRMSDILNTHPDVVEPNSLPKRSMADVLHHGSEGAVEGLARNILSRLTPHFVRQGSVSGKYRDIYSKAQRLAAKSRKPLDEFLPHPQDLAHHLGLKPGEHALVSTGGKGNEKSLLVHHDGTYHFVGDEAQVGPGEVKLLKDKDSYNLLHPGSKTEKGEKGEKGEKRGYIMEPGKDEVRSMNGSDAGGDDKSKNRLKELTHSYNNLVKHHPGGLKEMQKIDPRRIAGELRLNKGEHFAVHDGWGNMGVYHANGTFDVFKTDVIHKRGTTQRFDDDDMEDLLNKREEHRQAMADTLAAHHPEEGHHEGGSGIGDWWKKQSTTKKIMIGGGTAATGGIGTLALSGGHHHDYDDYSYHGEELSIEDYDPAIHGIMDEDTVETQDADDNSPDNLPDTSPVLTGEIVFVCCPHGILSEDDEASEETFSRIEALGSAIVATENAKLDSDLLKVLMNGNVIPSDSLLYSNESLGDVITSGISLSQEASQVIRDELKHEVIHLVTGLSADSVIGLNHQWKSIQEELVRIIADIGQNANHAVREGILTHYKYSSVDKVSDGVVSGAHLIYSLLQLMNKSSLMDGVDKVCEKANTLIKSFVDTYGEDFYIQDMVIEKSGDLRYNFNEKTYPQEDIHLALYSADGESPTTLGWENKVPVKLETKISKAQQILSKAFAHLDTLATRPTHIAQAMTTDGSNAIKDGTAIIFVSSLVRCISQILYRVVLWGSKLCEHSVDYIYKEIQS